MAAQWFDGGETYVEMSIWAWCIAGESWNFEFWHKLPALFPFFCILVYFHFIKRCQFLLKMEYCNLPNFYLFPVHWLIELTWVFGLIISIFPSQWRFPVHDTTKLLLTPPGEGLWSSMTCVNADLMNSIKTSSTPRDGPCGRCRPVYGMQIVCGHLFEKSFHHDYFGAAGWRLVEW